MKAAVYTQYGTPDVVQLKEVDKPMPKEHEVLVRIKATAVNSGDVRMRKADPFAVRFIFGFFTPRIPVLGAVFSGEVESVGKQVKAFKPGDQVFGHTDMRFGAHAEYICVAESGSVTLKPATLSHAEAATIPFGAVTALHFLKKAAIKPNQKVLIVGASGAVGSAAVQLARYYGARVTAVCSTGNRELVKSLGAERIIDYTKEDFTQQAETYDVIFDTVNSIAVPKALQVLNDKGTLILSAAGMKEMLQGAWYGAVKGRSILNGVIGHSATELQLLKELVDSGKYKPVVDRTYPLAQIAAAHAYVEQGHKKGNVAIAV